MTNSKFAARALLIDLDGVIYQDDILIPGALDSLAWIKEAGIPHLFATNTTSRSRDALLEKFNRLGFQVELDRIMTPVVAASRWLSEHDMRTAAMFVPRSTQTEFSDLSPVTLTRIEPVDAVIVGDLGVDWSYQLLNQAFRFLMQDPQPRLIALGMTRYWRAQDGLMLDVAPFIKALEHAANCTSLVMGKPAATFFDASLARLQCVAAQCLMIGDDIVGDIEGAQACGIPGILVRTGKFRQADLDAGIDPFLVLNSIADLPAWWSQAADMDAGESSRELVGPNT